MRYFHLKVKLVVCILAMLHVSFAVCQSGISLKIGRSGFTDTDDDDDYDRKGV